MAHPPLHRPRRRDHLRPRRRGPDHRAGYRGTFFDAPGAEFHHRPAQDGSGECCTFETLIAVHQLDTDPALVRLAKIVHAADIASDVDTDPAGAGLLAIGLGGLDVEPDDQVLLERGLFVYDALYAWCARDVAGTAATASA